MPWTGLKHRKLCPFFSDLSLSLLKLSDIVPLREAGDETPLFDEIPFLYKDLLDDPFHLGPDIGIFFRGDRKLGRNLELHLAEEENGQGSYERRKDRDGFSRLR